MKAVIMAGGEGTRLRPLTCNRPKPMVRIANKPIMEHIINLLKKNDINDIAVTLQYMPEIIRDYFYDGKEFGVSLKYFVENIPLGTAGSVKNAEELLDENFVVISGDALTDIDLRKAYQYHKEKNSMATIVLKRVDVPLEYGIVVVNEDGRIVQLLEKPSWGEVFSDTVNTGIYILSPEIFKYYRKNERFDFSKDLFPELLKDNVPMYGYITKDYWCDIGDIKAFLQSHIDILDKKVDIEISGKEMMDRIWIGKGTEIGKNVLLNSPCIIGKNCKIKNSTVVGDYSVIGDNNIIGERSGIKRSIMWENNILDSNVQLRGSVLSSKVHIKNDCSAFEYSVIGDDTVVKEKAVIKPNIKIWPSKLIETCSEVNSSLVWGSKFVRTIFGNRGVAGDINIDITPEYASKLGAAYGSMFKCNGKIGISCDDSSAAMMFKTAFISGLMSSGIELFDLGVLLIPITRNSIRAYNLDGGIHISTSVENIKRLSVDFLDKNGSNIERNMERKIENFFVREDFSRCDAELIKDIKYVNDCKKRYLSSIIKKRNAGNLGFKILLNSTSTLAYSTVNKLLEIIGCDVITNQKKKQGKIKNKIFCMESFSKTVKNNDYDLGVSIVNNSEKMILVDEKGRLITEDMFIVLMAMILFKKMKGCTMAVPVSASHVIDMIADINNGKIIRTKTSSRDIMKKIFENNINEEVMEQFAMNFDAMAGLVKILDFIKVNGYKLSELTDMIPEFHIEKKEVECPWNLKGKVIREIIQENIKQKIETIDGVKLYKDKGWVLVIPDTERPVCNIISEGSSEEMAEELTNLFAEKIKSVKKD